jgi:hypothetical protein
VSAVAASRAQAVDLLNRSGVDFEQSDVALVARLLPLIEADMICKVATGHLLVAVPRDTLESLFEKLPLDSGPLRERAAQTLSDDVCRCALCRRADHG